MLDKSADKHVKVDWGSDARAGGYVDRILKGDKSADLPVRCAAQTRVDDQSQMFSGLPRILRAFTPSSQIEAESSLRIIDCPCQLKGYGELARVAVQPGFALSHRTCLKSDKCIEI